MKTCTVDGCTKQHRARGLCVTHYNQKNQENRHQKRTVVCAHCGADLLKYPSGERRSFCDYTCRDLFSMEHRIGAYGREPKPPKPKADLRSPMRKAYEAEDWTALIAAIKGNCDIRPSGCWEWQRKTKDYYAVVSIGGKTKQVHRLSLEAKHGKPLGKQAAHHMCANTFCVNPDHLQPVTAAENTAEMLARTYLTTRIADLEAALRNVAPTHPLLMEVGIAAA